MSILRNLNSLCMVCGQSDKIRRLQTAGWHSDVQAKSVFPAPFGAVEGVITEGPEKTHPLAGVLFGSSFPIQPALS